MKKTAIIGATNNASRYAFIASEMLREYDHEFVPIGKRKGHVEGVEILDIFKKPYVEGVDTITLYLGPGNQVEHYNYILSLNPKRIIFNPGTENSEFEKLARDKGIETMNACTLVLLRMGRY